MAQLDDGSQIFPNGKTVVYHHFPPSILKKMVGSLHPSMVPKFHFSAPLFLSLPQVAHLHDHRVNQYRCNVLPCLALFFLTVQGTWRIIP